MLEIFSLTGKTILVTGASSGIGKAVAQQCAAAGANCILTARNQDRLQKTLESLEGEGHQVFVADLSSAEGVHKVIEITPKLDGIVCCAGTVETKMIKFTEDDNLLHLFNTNTFSVIRLVREIVQQKQLKRGASIVIISSISGVRCGYIGGSLYGATKGALEGFTKAIALELAPQKIRVNTITPGMIETPLMDGKDIDAIQIETDKLRYPLKRYGKAEEVAYTAVYMLSDATKWMTGTSLLIDGGYTLN